MSIVRLHSKSQGKIDSYLECFLPSVSPCFICLLFNLWLLLFCSRSSFCSVSSLVSFPRDREEEKLRTTSQATPQGSRGWLWNGWVQGSSTAQHSEHSDCYAGKLLNLQNMNIYKSLGHNFTISKFGLLLTDSFHRGKHWLQTHLVATGMSIVFSQPFWSWFFDLIGVKKIVV